jgi:hypothetical protein
MIAPSPAAVDLACRPATAMLPDGGLSLVAMR